ncbi:MAG: HRDC domain-containing protein [Phycisphaerales bacterium]|nr:HRDC domain-containing protein [Phycisphaerales bacterium]
MPENNKRPLYQQPAQSFHRANAHASAHADNQVIPLSQIPKLDLVSTGAAKVVDHQSGLDQLVQQLRSAGSFAYDSEFIGEMTYIPRLCLIQVATTSQIFLIDPLKKLNLNGFWELICNPSIEKIVHAGQQDIEPVFRHLPGRQPANVFDTQIAAGLIGLPYPVSLTKLVHELTGVRLTKSYTFTDWEHRPLSSAQLRYAADDVRYLALVRHKLGQRLEAAGHVDLARQVCDAQLDPAIHADDPDGGFSRIRHSGNLEPKNLAVLRALAIWRNHTARKENIPTRLLLRDEVLVAMARYPVESVSGLSRVKGLPRPVETQYGQELVQQTVAALNLPPDQMPAARDNSEESPAEKFKADSLLATVQAACFARSIDPALVLGRHDIDDILRLRRNGQSLDESRLMQGWRRAIIGDALVALLDGKSVGEIRWNNPLFRTTSP